MALDPKTILAMPYGDFEVMNTERPDGAVSKDLGAGGSDGLSTINGLQFTREPSTKRTPFADVQVAMLQGRSLRGNYISNTDRNKGRVSEDTFAKAASSAGLGVFVLPHFESNYKRHIDFEIEYQGRCFWIDVKSPKALRKTNRLDDPLNKPQDRYVCLQLTPNGDLYGSHSDYLAFGLTNGQFIIADRLKVIDCVAKCLVLTEGRSAWPETALWRPYVRTYNDFHLVMTYMDLEDLKHAIVAVI